MTDYGSYRNEYLITNNYGSYSSSNILYGNTRKYHGLLVATTDSLYKFNVLNRVIDSYRNVKTELPLSTNIYQNDYIEPKGIDLQSSFTLHPYPTWTFRSDSVEIVKSVFLSSFENTLTINYKFNSDISGFFNLKPLINFRDFHTVNSDLTEDSYKLEKIGNFIKIDLQNNNFLEVNHSGSEFFDEREIYYSFYYPEEASRGYLASENLLQLGYFETLIPEGEFELSFVFAYNTSSQPVPSLEHEFANVSETRNTGSPLKDFQEYLEKQSSLFINKTDSHTGICAGYHWFDEWSRDTFISLPGLTSGDEKAKIARQILEQWGEHLQNGLLPNRLLLTDMLNSLDGVFWFVIRLYEFSLKEQNFDLAERFLENLENILIQFQNKTHNIEITKQGFLYDNNSDDALTWMDAKVDDKPVINRSGMAVEIQALWYNYVRIMILLKEKLNDRTHLTYLKDLKVSMERNFETVFWNSSQNCLYDCVRNDFVDKSIRPNQVVVAYLPFKILGTRKNKMILATAEQKLLTPVGLRTLAREDPAYRGNYFGDQKNRDLSYHQGTVWPFLLGFYLCAYYETYLKTKSAKNYVVDKLLNFRKELERQQLNYVPEIFSADDLKPSGCLAQAWSVGLLLESLYGIQN